MEAIFKVGSHTFCSVLPVLPPPVGVAKNYAKRRLHFTVKPHFRHSNNVGTMSQNKITDEVTEIATEPPNIGRNQRQVSGEVSVSSPRVGIAGYRGGGARRVTVCPATKECSRRDVVLIVVA